MRTKWQVLFFVCCIAANTGLSHAADVVWRMVVLPDTQRYTLSEINSRAWINQMEWIVDNVDTMKIGIVLHTGDITENNIPQQWLIAKQAMSMLDGVVPYMMAYGNHDIWPLPEDKNQLVYNDYFSLSDNPLNNFVTERVPGDLSNTVGLFEAPDGRDLTIVNLEFKPHDDPAIYAWANDIFEQHPNSTGIVFTHHNLDESPDAVTEDGEPVSIRHGRGILNWNKLTGQQKNIELVLSGHGLDEADDDFFGPLTTAEIHEKGIHGNTVHELTFNAQQQPFAGNGFLRMLEFLDDGKTVQVRTYSPFLDLYLTNNRNEFQIELSPLLSADFDGDTDIDNSDLQLLLSSIGGSGVDSDRDGDADGADFLVWQRQYTGPLSPTSVLLEVPETSTVNLLLISLTILSVFNLPSRFLLRN